MTVGTWRKARVGIRDPKGTGQEDVGLAAVVTSRKYFCMESWKQGLQSLGGQREMAVVGKKTSLGMQTIQDYFR